MPHTQGTGGNLTRQCCWDMGAPFLFIYLFLLFWQSADAFTRSGTHNRTFSRHPPKTGRVLWFFPRDEDIIVLGGERGRARGTHLHT
ncbi:hypothetical protein LX32DRAFT_70666 [Colletotrichum zoysiae]|uniref:Uncharacterized protein n=1 Tax=Colletotrichum zoysiae TaxID=1216348 RepID=A0AAD9HBY2_9PEZI|nr:hypothetical protein LX32DRAFT_70666 [Colletotrichum zoysiae]